ncbi:polysaccharide deacetylase family protein [Leptospira santarosai]|uniref:polysaccharide deacetylase family protein n=2 Tax=Leptospira santarosai TaxID=28183 RepID=UPI00035CEBEE|nr:polysaccharide deacetylase family protein [Leptospira santarosai]
MRKKSQIICLEDVNKMNDVAHGIMFHHFHDEDKHIKSQGSISGEEFRNILLWLQRDFNIISAMEWFEKSKLQKLQKNDICITFDDNLLCQYTIALPILEELDIKAFWFIYSSPLIGVQEKLEIYRYFRSAKFNTVNDFYHSFGRIINESEYAGEVENKLKLLDTDQYLSAFPFYSIEDKIFRYTRDYILGRDRYYVLMDTMISQMGMDIKEISSTLWNTSSNLKYLDRTGHVIGLHSHTHPTHLSSLSYNQQLEEYNENLHILESIVSRKIFSMSHPCNSYNEDTINILKSMNINFGFRANMERGYSSTLEYPRIDHALLMNQVS